jgi:hypothetical protein
MRSDMHKIIVERPRLLRSAWTNQKTARRLSLNDCATALDAPEDYDGGPTRASSARHSKWLNENLAPLRRYLHQQVGRPWSNVYGEILKGIDTRSAVGLHVLQHVDGFVSTHVVIENRKVYYFGRGRLHPMTQGLYVHPRTGLLRALTGPRNPKPPQPSTAELDLVRVTETVYFEKRAGLWFRVEYRLRSSDEQADGRGRLEFLRKQQCDRKTVKKIEQRPRP